MGRKPGTSIMRQAVTMLDPTEQPCAGCEQPARKPIVIGNNLETTPQTIDSKCFENQSVAGSILLKQHQPRNVSN
jgi:hypothetical protein